MYWVNLGPTGFHPNILKWLFDDCLTLDFHLVWCCPILSHDIFFTTLNHMTRSYDLPISLGCIGCCFGNCCSTTCFVGGLNWLETGRCPPWAPDDGLCPWRCCCWWWWCPWALSWWCLWGWGWGCWTGTGLAYGDLSGRSWICWKLRFRVDSPGPICKIEL